MIEQLIVSHPESSGKVDFVANGSQEIAALACIAWDEAASKGARRAFSQAIQQALTPLGSGLEQNVFPFVHNMQDRFAADAKNLPPGLTGLSLAVLVGARTTGTKAPFACVLNRASTTAVYVPDMPAPTKRFKPDTSKTTDRLFSISKEESKHSPAITHVFRFGDSTPTLYVGLYESLVAAQKSGVLEARTAAYGSIIMPKSN